MKKYSLLIVAFSIALSLWFIGCQNDGPTEEPIVVSNDDYVSRIETDSLVMLFPNYSRIDLACDTMPSPGDTTALLVVAAAYTGAYLDTFCHSNIAGDHVSSGVRYGGYRCRSNSGAFVAYECSWDFAEGHYTTYLDIAAKHGGMGFGQEMMIYDSVIRRTIREDGSINIYRALCEKGKRLCVIETKFELPFGEFKQALLRAGVTNAIYLDGGGGWNYGWYRTTPRYALQLPATSEPQLAPPISPSRYATNWIVFYK